MSHQPVRTWQVLLQRLSDLKAAYTGSTDGLPQQYEAVKGAYDHLRAIPQPIPRASVKKIVQEQQVGFINPISCSCQPEFKSFAGTLVGCRPAQGTLFALS